MVMTNEDCADADEVAVDDAGSLELLRLVAVDVVVFIGGRVRREGRWVVVFETEVFVVFIGSIGGGVTKGGGRIIVVERIVFGCGDVDVVGEVEVVRRCPQDFDSWNCR